MRTLEQKTIPQLCQFLKSGTSEKMHVEGVIVYKMLCKGKELLLLLYFILLCGKKKNTHDVYVGSLVLAVHEISQYIVLGESKRVYTSFKHRAEADVHNFVYKNKYKIFSTTNIKKYCSVLVNNYNKVDKIAYL